MADFSPEDIAAFMDAAPSAPSTSAPAAAPAAHGFSDDDIKSFMAPEPTRQERIEAAKPSYMKVAQDERQGALTSFGGNLVNTMLFNVPRNLQAYSDYVRGNDGRGPKYESFEQAYQHAKAVDEQGNHDHPYASKAGVGAGLAGAVLAAPAVMPEAGMAALYAGGLPAVARSAAIGGGLAGGSTYADTHDPYKAAAAAVAGGVAGPVADKAVNLTKPMWRAAEQLVPREVQAAMGAAAAPGTPGWARGQVADVAKQMVGSTVGGAAGAGAGALAGALLPGEYGHYLGGVSGGGAGTFAGWKAIERMNAQRDALQSEGKFYSKGNRGAALVGAALPAMLGLLGE